MKFQFEKFWHFIIQKKSGCIFILPMVLNFKIGNSPESYTTLLGSLVRHVDVGSGLNITCAVVNYPLKLEYIIFYHNNKVNDVQRPPSPS